MDSKITVGLRTGQSFNGKFREPGEIVEVTGTEQVAMVGTSPSPRKFHFIAVFKDGNDTPYAVHTSNGVEWSDLKSKDVEEAANIMKAEIAGKPKKAEPETTGGDDTPKFGRMTKAELIAYAEKNEIDLEDAETKAEIVAVIEAAIEEGA